MKDPTTQDIVVDAIRDVHSFDSVEKRLQRKYDQPRMVFTEDVIGLVETISFTSEFWIIRTNRSFVGTGHSLSHHETKVPEFT